MAPLLLLSVTLRFSEPLAIVIRRLFILFFKLEKINRKAAHFIKGDFKKRTPGCVTEMMCDLDLPTLQKRRKEKRLSEEPILHPLLAIFTSQE